MIKGKDSKPHIGIFGRRNNGKSSLINALADQEIAIVSEIAGTTTDPVKKSMEIFGVGPVVLIDTAGIDDVGEIGVKRVAKTKEVLQTIDLAILVIVNNNFGNEEVDLISQFLSFNVPFVVVHNKSDILPLDVNLKEKIEHTYKAKVVDFSSVLNSNISDIINEIKNALPETAYTSKSLFGDLINRGDIVLLITPIDSEAPEGRMILPQVQAIRDTLDNDSIAVVLKETEIETYFSKIQVNPKLVITDSQVFPKVNAAIPKDISLTSFSIILARQKGDFYNYLKGTPHLSNLKNGDKILILESCTHQTSCDDIGRVKIPTWLTNFTKKKLEFDVVAGLTKLNRDIKEYAMVIQCGGCVITKKQIINRLKQAVDAGVPVTNYGMAIAYMHGIYDRAIAPFQKSDNNDSNNI